MFAWFFNLGGMEIIILLVVGVLLFGRRLPEVGRYLGKGIVEFKKGIKGIEDEVNTAQTSGPAPVDTAKAEPPKAPQRIGANAPKFQDTSVDSEGQPRFQNG